MSNMSNSQDLRVEPVAPTGTAKPVQAARRAPEEPEPAPKLPAPQDMAVVTNGEVHAAYTEFVINPDTHEVVVRIRHANTDRVLDELASAEIQALQKGNG